MSGSPRVSRALRALGSRRPSAGPGLRRALLAIAAVGFGVGLVLSLRARPELRGELRVAPLLGLIAAGPPLTMAFNGLEFRLTGRLVGSAIPFGRALEVSVMATAANLLPLPGGSLVRVGALKADGVSLARGGATTVFSWIVWIAVSCGFAASWLLVVGRPTAAALFGGAGLAAGAGAVGIAATALEGPRTAAALAALRLSMVAHHGLRLLLALWALGATASYPAAGVLTVSGAAGAVVSTVPGGLGVREGAAAGMAPLAGLAPATAFLAAALNRVVAMAAVLPLALALAGRAGRERDYSRE